MLLHEHVEDGRSGGRRVALDGLVQRLRDEEHVFALLLLVRHAAWRRGLEVALVLHVEEGAECLLQLLPLQLLPPLGEVLLVHLHGDEAGRELADRLVRRGEIRGLQWQNIDLDANTVSVRRSLLPDGTPKDPKTEAGERTVPMLPALRRLLVAWKVRSPKTRPDQLVICTADGGAVQERNLRRALDDAKATAALDGGAERLSWHSLRHSFASMLATDLELAGTTLARLTGHKDAGFTLKVYARDKRKTGVVVADVLARAASGGIAL